jgi:hypothetical protein
MTFRHISNAGKTEKGKCKDCARSRVAGEQRFCAIKEQFTRRQAPVDNYFSCVAFKPVDKAGKT